MKRFHPEGQTEMIKSTLGPLDAVAIKLGSLWWTLVLVGALWIVIGFVVLRFDNSTVEVVAIVFGITVLLAAAGEIFRAAITPGGWRLWHISFALLLLIGAVIIFVHPGTAFVSLAVVVGIYFVFVGTFDIISSLFMAGQPGWWLQLLAGGAQILLGFLASSSFTSGAIVLVTYVSVIAIFRGISEIGAGFSVRALAGDTK